MDPANIVGVKTEFDDDDFLESVIDRIVINADDMDTGNSGITSNKTVFTFSCSVCDMKFKKSKKYKRHLLTHKRTDKRTLNCLFCEKKFDNSASLCLHVIDHARNQYFPCLKCKKFFRTKTDLNKHILRHSGKRDQCSRCGLLLANRSDALSHSKFHASNEDHLKCYSCQKTFTMAAKLKMHAKEHQTFLKCRQCKKQFLTNSGLKLHSVMYRHYKNELYDVTEKRPIETQVSFDDSDNDDGLGYEMSSPQLKIKTENWSCDSCGKAFKSETSLKKHRTMMGHKDGSSVDKTVTCDICHLEVNRYYLPLHMRIHTDEKPFLCRVCYRSFRLPQQLKIHERIHTGEKPYKCTKCDKTFNQATRMKRHIKNCKKRIKTVKDVSHSVSSNLESSPTPRPVKKKGKTRQKQKKKRECTYCGKQNFSTKQHLDDHIRIHTGERPFECKICGKAFKQRSGATKHEQVVHSDHKTYTCELCQQTFDDMEVLKNHRDTDHKDDKPHECDVCHKRFQLKNTFLMHKKTHSPTKPHQCTHCGKAFHHKAHLKEHIIIHTNEKKFICEICGKGLRSKRVYRNHLIVHIKESNLDPASFGITLPPPLEDKEQCSECGKKFANKARLVCHMRTHTGERPYKCPHCDVAYKERTLLRTHMFKHTGERPYVCQFCHMGFRVKLTLRNHLRTHTGERPYECKICSKGFKQKTSLDEHMTTHTGSMPHICDQCGRGFPRPSKLRKHQESAHGRGGTLEHQEEFQAPNFVQPDVGANCSNTVDSATGAMVAAPELDRVLLRHLSAYGQVTD